MEAAAGIYQTALAKEPMYNTGKVESQETILVLREILNWSTIFTCSFVSLNFLSSSNYVPVHFHQYPLLYNCAQIQFWNFANFTQKKEKKNFEVQLKFCSAADEMTELLFIAKQSFAEAESPCSYHLQIFHISECGNPYFRTPIDVERRSVVNKDIPDDSLAAGVPCKV
uniref:Uncharacterized protein n=1 Tax=Ditylenchus dipsaci TaxID=166011 RepID=A0A915CXW1_9BILA